MINFIGSGSAFNTELGNNSAFIKKNSSLILIDCGGTTFHRLQQLNLFEGIENLFIVITHSHLDHVGSLGDIIAYSYYILNLKPTIFFPEKELLEGFLTSVGITSELYYLNNLDSVEVNDDELGKFNIEFIAVTHVDTIPSYGFIIKIGGSTFYYSGDANDINSTILDKLKNGEIGRIYQDTCGLDYDGNAHLFIGKLCELIPMELRKKVYCMHLDKHINQDEIKNNGFNVIKVY